MSAGSLTIVGLGPARPEQLTVEAVACLEQARANCSRVYGLAHARELASVVAPGLEVRSLDYLYNLEGVERPDAYRDLARMLVRRAFSDDVDVVYLVAGSPLFINDAVLLIRQVCAQAGHPLRIIHGLSFVEVVLERVFWRGHRGLQLYSAWNVARDGCVPDLDAPVLLCQLGEFTQSGDALRHEGSLEILVELRDRLLEHYPADHPVIVLYSSGRPHYDSMARKLALSDLAEEVVPIYSNLWIPPRTDPGIEAEVAPAEPTTAGRAS